MKFVAREFRLNVLRRSGFRAFQLNLAHSSACYRLGWTINLASQRALVDPFLCLKQFDRETDPSLGAWRQEDYEDSPDIISVKSRKRGFQKENIPDTAGKDPHNYAQNTSVQANSVLFKSEELCRRVSSMMERISHSRSLSIETPSLVSTSRLNLHIPDVILESPLSPLTSLSMGELDSDRQLTQRSNKLQKEIGKLERAEQLWNVWKEWKNYVMQRKIVTLKKTIAAKTAYNRRARLFLTALRETVRAANNRAECVSLAKAFHATRVQAKVIKLLHKASIDGEYRGKAEEMFRDRIGKKVLKILHSRAHRKTGHRAKLKSMRNCAGYRVKFKFFNLLKIQTQILARESRQKDIAETVDNTRRAKSVLQALSTAAQAGHVRRQKNAAAIYCFFRRCGQKHFNLLKAAGKLSSFYQSLLDRAQDYYLDVSYRKGFDALSKLRKVRRSNKLLRAKAALHFRQTRSLKVLTQLRCFARKQGQDAQRIEQATCSQQQAAAIKALTAWRNWVPKRVALKEAADDWAEAKGLRVVHDSFYIWMKRAEDSVTRHHNLTSKGIQNTARRIFKAWRSRSRGLAYTRLRRQDYFYQFDKGVATRILSRWHVAASVQSRQKHNNEIAVRHFTDKHYLNWRTSFRKRTLFRYILERYSRKGYFCKWAAYAARTRLEYRQNKAAAIFNSYKLKRCAFRAWFKGADSMCDARIRTQALKACLSDKEHIVKKKIVVALKFNAVLKRKAKLAKQLASKQFTSTKLAIGFGRWLDKLRHSTARRHLTARVIKGWKKVAVTQARHNDLIDGFRKRQASLACLQMLQAAAHQKQQLLDAKATKFRLSIGLSRWVQHLHDVGASQRHMLKMQRKADEFAEVSRLFRGLKKLKQNSEQGDLMKTARLHSYNAMVHKGLQRWKLYHDRFLKPLGIARTVSIRLQDRRHRMAFKRWHKRVKASSLSHRLEYRRDFFSRMHLQRLLSRWHTIVAARARGRDLSLEFRIYSLKSRTLKGLGSLQMVKVAKGARDTEQRRGIRLLRLKVWLHRLKLCISAQKFRRNALEAAGQLREEKLCRKVLGAWPIGCHTIHKSERLLPELFYTFCQRRTIKSMSEDDLPDAVVDSIVSRLKADGSDPRINAYAQVLNFSVPLVKLPSVTGRLYTCWRTAVCVKALVKESKADEANRWRRLMASMQAWRKLVTLSKARMRTMTTAILFHRYRLRHRTVEAWRSLLRRRR